MLFYQSSVIESYILFSSLLQMYGSNNYNTFRQNQASGNSVANLSASRVGGNAYQSQNKDNLGSYRLNTYIPEERPPRSQDTKNWDVYPTLSITAKEQTLHLSSIELRTEDYFLIRNKRLQQNEAKHLQRAIDQKCFNQELLRNQCYNLMCFSRQPPISNINASNSNIYNRFNNVNSVNTNNQTNGNIYSANNNSQNNNNSNNSQNSNNRFSTNNQNLNYGNNNFNNQGVNTNNGSIQGGNMSNSTRMTSSNLMNNNSNNSNNNNNVFSNNSNNNNQNSFNNNPFNNFGGEVHGNHRNNLNNNGGNNTFNNTSRNHNNNNMINGNNPNNQNFMANNSNGTNSMNNNINNGNFNNVSSNNSNSNIDNPCNNQYINNKIFSKNNTNHCNNSNHNNSNNIFNSQNNNIQGQNTNNYPINQPFQPNNQQNTSLFGCNSQMNSYMNQQTNLMGFNHNGLNMLFDSYSDITSVDRLYKQFGKNLLQLFSNLDDQRKQISSSQNNYASEYSKGYQQHIQPFFSRAFRKQREQITITVVQKKQASPKQTHQRLMKRNQKPLTNESNMLPVQSRIKRQEEHLNSPNKQFKSVFINNFSPGRKAPYSVFLEVKWLDKYKNANVDKVIIKKNRFQLLLFDYYNERDLQLLLHNLKEHIPIIRNDAKLIIDYQQSSFQNQIVLVGVIEQRLINIDPIQYETRFSSIRNGFINGFIISKKKDGSKTATIAWDKPIDYETLDFSLPDAFNLQLSEVICDIPALNSKCRITFESLPPKINKLFKQLGKKAATQALKSFLDRKNEVQKIFELCSIHDDGSWTFIVHKFN